MYSKLSFDLIKYSTDMKIHLDNSMLVWMTDLLWSSFRSVGPIPNVGLLTDG